MTDRSLWKKIADRTFFQKQSAWQFRHTVNGSKTSENNKNDSHFIIKQESWNYLLKKNWDESSATS